VSGQDPKFSDFYSWALQYAPTRKKSKARIKQPPPSTPIQPDPRIRRLWAIGRYHFPALVVQVLAALIAGVPLTFLSLWLATSHSESAPPIQAQQPAHPWYEDMTVTPTAP
jgi:hypothetical protein